MFISLDERPERLYCAEFPTLWFLNYDFFIVCWNSLHQRVISNKLKFAHFKTQLLTVGCFSEAKKCTMKYIWNELNLVHVKSERSKQSQLFKTMQTIRAAINSTQFLYRHCVRFFSVQTSASPWNAKTEMALSCQNQSETRLILIIMTTLHVSERHQHLASSSACKDYWGSKTERLRTELSSNYKATLNAKILIFISASDSLWNHAFIKICFPINKTLLFLYIVNANKTLSVLSNYKQFCIQYMRSGYM